MTPSNVILSSDWGKDSANLRLVTRTASIRQLQHSVAIFLNYHRLKMNSAVRILAFGLQLSISRARSCPPSFTERHNVCLHFRTYKLTYCQAQAYCSSVGGELVRGNNYLQLVGKSSLAKYKFWIGLTDLLRERRRNRSGWRWSDGAEDPPSSDLKWKEIEPKNRNGAGDCVMQCSGTGMLCDNYGCSPSKTNRALPLCQPRSLPTSVARVRGFEAVPIPVGLPEEEFAEGGGCAKLIADVKSSVSCGVLCGSKSNAECVSFYFNKERQECRLQLYTDATVQMNGARGWKKFVKRM